MYMYIKIYMYIYIHTYIHTKCPNTPKLYTIYYSHKHHNFSYDHNNRHYATFY